MGNLCGYVGVPLGTESKVLADALESIAHGGITFEGPCNERVCHVPLPGEPEVHWYGFDCAHAYDWVPGWETMFKGGRCGWPGTRSTLSRARRLGTYRTVAYVRAVCEEMADYVAERVP